MGFVKAAICVIVNFNYFLMLIFKSLGNSFLCHIRFNTF